MRRKPVTDEQFYAEYKKHKSVNATIGALQAQGYGIRVQRAYNVVHKYEGTEKSKKRQQAGAKGGRASGIVRNAKAWERKLKIKEGEIIDKWNDIEPKDLPVRGVRNKAIRIHERINDSKGYMLHVIYAIMCADSKKPRWHYFTIDMYESTFKFTGEAHMYEILETRAKQSPEYKCRTGASIAKIVGYYRLKG